MTDIKKLENHIVKWYKNKGLFFEGCFAIEINFSYRRKELKILDMTKKTNNSTFIDTDTDLLFKEVYRVFSIESNQQA